jgi:thiamine-monophosphate kinase
MPLSEFDLIERYFARQTPSQNVDIGIGDDCAVVTPPPGSSLAITTDTLIEGVHFPVNTAPADIAIKTLAVNFSDLAAMGARPHWVTLSLTMPDNDEIWLDEFAAALHDMLGQFECALVGGDTTRGPLSITLQAIGLIKAGRVMRRDLARPGDRIYVTGTIGDAAIALAVLDRPVAERDWFLQRLHRPSPRVGFGIDAAEFCVCAIDISDGLAADLAHVIQSSGVGAVVHLPQIPLSAQAKSYFDAAGGIDWQQLVTGGDDYELLLTVPERHEPALLALADEHQMQVTCIGEVTSEAKMKLLLCDGTELPLDHKGYRHF